MEEEDPDFKVENREPQNEAEEVLFFFRQMLKELGAFFFVVFLTFVLPFLLFGNVFLYYNFPKLF